jgi:uncharacterized protein (TIGR02145 family)
MQTLITTPSQYVSSGTINSSWNGVISGYCDYNGNNDKYLTNGYYWEKTEDATYQAYMLSLYDNNGIKNGYSTAIYKAWGLSVRCVKSS